MSKLSAKDRLESLNEIKKYRIDNPGTKKKRAVVEKNGKTIFDDKVPVVAGDYNIYFNVDIIWEDADFDDYSKYGLCGSYSSDYNVATYNNSILQLCDNDNSIVITII